MSTVPDIGTDLIAALEQITRSDSAVWLQGADSPGYIYCYAGNERIDFLVYVEPDVVGSPHGDVAAVTATFRNIHALYLQSADTCPALLELLRSAQEDHELFRSLQKKCIESARSALQAMVQAIR